MCVYEVQLIIIPSAYTQFVYKSLQYSKVMANAIEREIYIDIVKITLVRFVVVK